MGVIPSREDGEGSPASSVAGDSSPSSRLGMTHRFNIDAALVYDCRSPAARSPRLAHFQIESSSGALKYSFPTLSAASSPALSKRTFFSSTSVTFLYRRKL